MSDDERARIKPHLFVSVLAGGGKTWDAFQTNLDSLKALAPAAGLRLTVSYDSGTGVDRARNRQVALARKLPGVTHFMFLDNDVVFDPTWVVNMVASGFDVVAGAYPRKVIEWECVEAAVKAGVPANILQEYSTGVILNTVPDNSGGPNALQSDYGTFVEVEEAGTGFFMFKMSVVEKMIDAYGIRMAYVTDYEPFGEVQHMLFACQRDPACDLEVAAANLLEVARTVDPDSWTLQSAVAEYRDALQTPTCLGRYLTEDYAFCRLWRMLGGKIYVYIDAALGHIGPYCFRGALKNYLVPADKKAE